MDKCKISTAEIAYKLFGQSQTTIVIDTCIASCSAEWWHIADKLKDIYQVLVYDRAGYGESSRSSNDRTPKNIAMELDELLSALGISKNIILIGHSQGGFYAARYALMFPEKIKSLILLDPETPFDNEFRHRLSPKEYKNSGVDKSSTFGLSYFLTLLHLGFLLKPLFVRTPPFYYYDFPCEAKDYLLSSLLKSKTYLTAFDEYNYTHLKNTMQGVIDGIDNCGLTDIPLVLVTHSSSVYIKELKVFNGMDDESANKIETLWQEIMKRYLEMSNNSRHITAENSGHYIHLTDYELLESIIKSQ